MPAWAVIARDTRRRIRNREARECVWQFATIHWEQSLRTFPPSRRNSQQTQTGFGNLLYGDSQQPCLGLATATMIAPALGAPKHGISTTIWTISGRIRWTKDGNNRRSQCIGKMQGSGIST